MPTPRSEPSASTSGGAGADRRRTGAGRFVAAALLAVGALLLLAGPALLNAYWLRVLASLYMYAVLAQGMNIMAGYTGYPAFGNVVFFGLAGYVTGILMVRLEAPFMLALLGGVALCPLLVLTIGPALLRLKGHYFAIATLGLNEAVKEVVSNTTTLTGGGMGLSLPLPPGGPAQNAAFFYYLMMGALVFSLVLTWRFRTTRLGIACQAIRDNEVKAQAMGIRTTRAKTAAWMVSAALTGLAGGVNAYWLTYIDPPSVFDMGIAVKAFVIFLLGGAGTVFGPLIGAVFVESLATLTWSRLLDWHTGAMGVVIMLVVVFFPSGFPDPRRGLPAVRRVLRGLTRGRRDSSPGEPRPDPLAGGAGRR